MDCGQHDKGASSGTSDAEPTVAAVRAYSPQQSICSRHNGGTYTLESDGRRAMEFSLHLGFRWLSLGTELEIARGPG